MVCDARQHSDPARPERAASHNLESSADEPTDPIRLATSRREICRAVRRRATSPRVRLVLRRGHAPGDRCTGPAGRSHGVCLGNCRAVPRRLTCGLRVAAPPRTRGPARCVAPRRRAGIRHTDRAAGSRERARWRVRSDLRAAAAQRRGAGLAAARTLARVAPARAISSHPLAGRAPPGVPERVALARTRRLGAQGRPRRRHAGRRPPRGGPAHLACDCAGSTVARAARAPRIDSRFRTPHAVGSGAPRTNGTWPARLVSTLGIPRGTKSAASSNRIASAATPRA